MCRQREDDCPRTEALVLPIGHFYSIAKRSPMMRFTFRIITLDQHPRRHSDNRAGPYSDCHRTIEDPSCGSRDGSTSCLLLLFVLVLRRHFVSRSFLTLSQRGGTSIVTNRKVALVRHDPDFAILISDFKFRPITRCWS